jgi:hypothetical protein
LPGSSSDTELVCQARLTVIDRVAHTHVGKQNVKRQIAVQEVVFRFTFALQYPDAAYAQLINGFRSSSYEDCVQVQLLEFWIKINGDLRIVFDTRYVVESRDKTGILRTSAVDADLMVDEDVAYTAFILIRFLR